MVAQKIDVTAPRGITFPMSICPICGGAVTPRSGNAAFPFCTSRCKSIDLGKWLNEEYRVPTPPDEAGEGGDPLGAVDEPELDSPAKTDMRH